MKATLDLSPEDVPLLLGAIGTERAAALAFPLPADPVAAAETKANVEQRIAALDEMAGRLENLVFS